MQPYKDSSNIRSFSKNVKKLELVWHKDDEDRDIEILEGKGWQMQFDDELPFDTQVSWGSSGNAFAAGVGGWIVTGKLILVF